MSAQRPTECLIEIIIIIINTPQKEDCILCVIYNNRLCTQLLFGLTTFGPESFLLFYIWALLKSNLKACVESSGLENGEDTPEAL